MELNNYFIKLKLKIKWQNKGIHNLIGFGTFSEVKDGIWLGDKTLFALVHNRFSDFFSKCNYLVKSLEHLLFLRNISINMKCQLVHFS